MIYALNFTLVSNANGSSTIALSATEGSLSTTTNFTLTVTPTSHSPSFVLSTNFVALTEESPAVTVTGFITAWTPSTNWTFIATADTNESTNVVFAALPSVDTNGTLTFAPAAHSFGTNLVTLAMTNSGGTNGAITTAFQIGVAQTNHAPVVVVPTNATILENATNGLTNAINVWSYDTQASNFVLTATSLSTNLVTVSISGTNLASTTNAVFTLTYVVPANSNGVATIQLSASEGALSTATNFTLTITAVNQRPTFALATNYMQTVTNMVLVTEESLPVTNIGFLTNLLAGPPNEISQTWSSPPPRIPMNPPMCSLRRCRR